MLELPWILDADVTIKTLYGHQKGATVGYNHHKPGRPSHTYHTYMIANVRLILEVEVQAGNRSSSAYTAPGLWTLLDRITVTVLIVKTTLMKSKTNGAGAGSSPRSLPPAVVCKNDCTDL